MREESDGERSRPKMKDLVQLDSNNNNASASSMNHHMNGLSNGNGTTVSALVSNGYSRKSVNRASCDCDNGELRIPLILEEKLEDLKLL